MSAFYADGRPLTIPEVRTMGDRFAPSRTCPRSSCSRARGWPDEGPASDARRLRRDRGSLARVRPRDPTADARRAGRPREGARRDRGDPRVRDRLRRARRRRKAGRVRARQGASARLRHAHRPLCRQGRPPKRRRNRPDARGALGLSRARNRAAGSRGRGRERRSALALRALGPARRGRDHDRLDRGSRSEAREAGSVVVRLDPHPDRQRERGRARGSPVRPASSRRLARLAGRAADETGGSPSTTTSATAIRTCCAGSRASSRTGWGR